MHQADMMRFEQETRTNPPPMMQEMEAYEEGGSDKEMKTNTPLTMQEMETYEQDMKWKQEMKEAMIERGLSFIILFLSCLT